jgi:two-component system, NtrC family, response regulator AtoC
MDRILIVEDTDSLREVLTVLLEREGYAVDSFGSAEEALRRVAECGYACILADFKLPGKNGLEFLSQTRELSPHVPFIIMTAYGSIDIAVTAMKMGANDFLAKPFEPDTLCGVIQDVLSHQRIIDRGTGSKAGRQRTFITRNSDTHKLIAQAQKVARVDTSVLILGESGTGKELIARYIHDSSPRRDAPFVALNCSAFPADLLESEFFGHEAGAYTGATQKRIGVFEYASQGTIFLDEVGDMPPALQVKLLRALQENEIKRIGSNKTIKINPRIIAATNHDMEQHLADARMREDFYYRIAVVTLTIPPLRQRPEDIELLTGNYVTRFAQSIGKPDLTLSPEAVALIRRYRWPGNVRELENVMERAVILAEKSILPEHLGLRMGLDLEAIEQSRLTLHDISACAAQKAEADIILKTLQETLRNKAKAARLLGVSYKTLLNKVKEYGIQV